jgi:alpha-D-xyloside xylohydrolase
MPHKFGLTSAMILAIFFNGNAIAQQQKVVVPLGKSTIVLEPYAPNVVRVTLSLDKDQALAAPGYGIVGTPAPEGWTSQETNGTLTYRSSRLVVTLPAEVRKRIPASTPATQEAKPTNVQETSASIAKFFNGSTPGANIRFSTPDGKLLLEMSGWQMSVPNYKDGNANILHDRGRLMSRSFK